MKRGLFRIPAVIVLLAFLLACNGTSIFPTEEPPGVGEKAEKGYAVSQPVIAALESFKADRGSYPQSLTELVPDYLTIVPTKTDELDFSYTSTGGSYRFSFHYIGPGMNTCTYASDAQGWECSGAY